VASDWLDTAVYVIHNIVKCPRPKTTQGLLTECGMMSNTIENNYLRYLIPNSSAFAWKSRGKVASQTRKYCFKSRTGKVIHKSMYMCMCI